MFLKKIEINTASLQWEIEKKIMGVDGWWGWQFRAIFLPVSRVTTYEVVVVVEVNHKSYN